MNKEKVSSPTQFVISGDFLSDFMTTFQHPANVKDSKTGKYLLVNQATVDVCGLQSEEEFIGLTVQDLDGLVQSRWGDTYVHVIENLDAEVKQRQHKVADTNRVLLANGGFVRIQNMWKIPVFNSRHQIKTIFTYSEDVTQTIDLLSLFALYKQLYSDTRMAIDLFMRYLKMDHYFSENLTETELGVLIAMKYNSAHKSVARKLSIQPKTVEIHTSHLRNKLKDGCLYKLLAKLRQESANFTS